MKTGLLTFYHIHHYGAMLQAYATERAVASLGSECEIIDYYVNQDNTLFQRPTGLGSAAHDAHTALHYGPLKARYERFEAFSRENLNISGRRYQSLEELRQAELPYDVLLSGSDQIWNPKIFPDGRFDPVFFGAFSHKRKIAYAPSFGIPRIPDGMEEELRTYLESFSHLSVRERQGQGIVRDITGKDVPVVLDPTLLLERTDWAAAARDGGAGRGYILCYCISRPDTLAPYIRRLAEETGLPVVQLCGVRQKVHPKARCILSAGPAEFLGLFRDAAYVCTNSFHGTVFSVQFQKPFFTAVAPAEMAAPESSRTFSLLSRLGLGERIIGKGDTADLTAPIDWAAVGEPARPGAEVVPGLSALRPGGPAPYTGGGACQGRGTALAPFGGPHPLHRLHGLRQRLSQGRHHHGAGPGGLCLSGDRRSGLCAVRALHGGVPRPAGAASELHARCIRGLE